MTATNNATKVLVADNQRVVYERKTWFIFSWWVKVNTVSIGKDLHIITNEPFERVIINDELYIKQG